MKKLIPLLLATMILLSCSEEVKILDFPLTSSSTDAARIASNELFFKNNDTPFRVFGFSDSFDPALEEAIGLDQNFYFAKAVYAYGTNNNNFKNNERRAYIESAYENINKVSEIEKAIIESIYFNIIEGNKIKAARVLNEVVEKYPDYYYLRVYNGLFQNTVMQNAKESELNWKEALKINPGANIAKIQLAQLHYPTTPGFYRLEEDEIDLDFATKMIKEIEETEPNNPELKQMQGNIFRVKGDFDSSINAYAKAIELTDKKSFGYPTLFLVTGHCYLFKKEYEKAREFYQKAIDLRDSEGEFGYSSFIRRWYANTYLYEKKYDDAIISINENQKELENYDLEPVEKNNLSSQIAFEKFLAYGHSQMKNEALESLNNMILFTEEEKKIRISNSTLESEIKSIELEVELNQNFHKIWYSILFGEYENARQLLKEFTIVSSEYLAYNSKAMVGFYKLSGYLNLMEGNIAQSISFYEQVPNELLEIDNYHLYFYALAKKANGNIDESKELFNYLANYNFAGWQNSIVRNLAIQQVES